jgi:hypothetical protein
MNQLKNSEFLFLNQNQSPNPLKKKLLNFFKKIKPQKQWGQRARLASTIYIWYLGGFGKNYIFLEKSLNYIYIYI